MATQPTDVPQFIEDLCGGVFEEKLASVLSMVAESVDTHDKSGEITIKLSMKKIGSSSQVNISHKIAYSHPTMRGKKGEEDTTETPMYVNPGGRLTLFPEHQGQMFDKPKYTQEKAQ